MRKAYVGQRLLWGVAKHTLLRQNTPDRLDKFQSHFVIRMKR
jgi:hypothetical protein